MPDESRIPFVQILSPGNLQHIYFDVLENNLDIEVGEKAWHLIRQAVAFEVVMDLSDTIEVRSVYMRKKFCSMCTCNQPGMVAYAVRFMIVETFDKFDWKAAG